MSKCYKNYDEIVFKLLNEEYNYTVIQSVISNYWFLSNNCGCNSKIFRALNITDKKQFCKDVSGYNVIEGAFPEICCPDSTGITKVINKLMEMCEEKMKESLKTEEKVSIETISQQPIFKVGDYVRVISKDKVQNGSKYRFYFTDNMKYYCDQIYIIASATSAKPNTRPLEPDDGIEYCLKDLGGNRLPYSFASSMLIPYVFSPLTLSGCIKATTDFETKAVSKKSTPEYKLKFTN